MKPALLPRNASLLPFLLASTAALFIVANLIPAAPKPTRLWRGYYTLLVREGSEAERRLIPLLPSLSAGRAAVSAFTSPVGYTDFEGVREVTVSELVSALDPFDPRFDPYMQGLPGYFTAGSGGWGIFYVPSYRNAFFLSLRLLASLGSPLQWGLVELPPVSALVAAVFLAVLSLLLARSLDAKIRDASFLVHLNALLWAPFVLTGDPSAACMVCVESILWLRLLQATVSSARGLPPRGRQGSPVHGAIAGELFVYLLCSALLGVLAALVLDASPERAFTTAAAVLSSLVLAWCPFPLYAQGRQTSRAAPGGGRKAAKKPGRRAALEPAGAAAKTQALSGSLAAAGTGFTLVVMVLALIGPGPLPTPRQALVPGAVTWESVGAAVPKGSLPDFRDAVAHEAFQQGLVFGRTYAVPSRDERVKVPEYIWSESGRSLVEAERTVRVFDDAWLDGTVSHAATGSVERMLLRQQSPFGVALTERWRLMMRVLPFCLSCLLLFSALCVLPRAQGPLISGGQWRINRRA
jgi:hypothetical protein